MFWFKLKCTSEEYFTQRRKEGRKEYECFLASLRLCFVPLRETESLLLHFHRIGYSFSKGDLYG